MLDQRIEIIIGHKACRGDICLNCIYSCPREILQWDKVQKKVVIDNFQDCVVCLACEEACREDGGHCLKITNTIKKVFKPNPKIDMWVGAKDIIPPTDIKSVAREDK
jgi:NAD-dependent dihydropyrimidine dehydrogenase PreA subunit